MKAKEFISEAPLKDYEPMGDFQKPGSFNDKRDKKLIQNPVNTQKVFKFFENTPYDFRIFPVNVPGLRQHSETGIVSPAYIQKMFVKQPEIAATILQEQDDDTITIVYVSNTGAGKVPLTPWIMAHRFGHAIQASNRQNGFYTWGEAEKYLFNVVNEQIEEIYNRTVRGGSRGGFNTGNTEYYNALFNIIGTQRSSRQNQITRPYEFLYELFAQFLQTGDVKLNPFPRELPYGKAAWGRKSTLTADTSYDDSELTNAADSLSSTMRYAFDDVLNEACNKIFVM